MVFECRKSRKNYKKLLRKFVLHYCVAVVLHGQRQGNATNYQRRRKRQKIISNSPPPNPL